MTSRLCPRTLAVIAVPLCLAWVVACNRGGDGPKPAVETAPAPTTTAPLPAPVLVPSVLDGVIAKAIQPPPEGGSTYRVDAYVGALVIEHLRRDPQPFTAWRRNDSDASRPEAGYRVGPLSADDVWTRLGLREGDIVHALNGVPITREAWIGEVLARGENQVNVTVFREDVSIVLSYRMMGAMAWNGLRLELMPPTEVAVVELEELPPDDDPTRTSGAGASSSGGSGAGASSSGGSGGSGGSGASTPSTGGSGESRPSTGGTGSASRPSSGGSGGTGSSAGTGGSSTRPSSGGGSTRPAVARCSSDSQCTLDKAHFDGLVRSPSKIESQARIVPAISNDVHSGYKLKTVTSGSAIDQLGFRAGDKITHINGLDLTNDMEAMQLYMSLSSTRRFRVRYVRGGSTRNKTIDVV